MKRKIYLTLLALICALCCAFALIACGDENDGNNGDGGETTVYEKTSIAHTPQGGSAAAHNWDRQNRCSVCGYELEVTDGLVYTETEGGYSVALGTMDGENFTGADGIENAEEIVIPAYYNDQPVVHIGDYNTNCFWAGSFKTLTVPNTIRSADDYAFYYCGNLETVYLGCNVFNGMFYEVRTLKNVYLSPDITKIGEGAFKSCSSLESAIIPDSVTELSKEAYYYCFAVTELKIGAGVTAIPENAFTSLRHITRVEIPAGIRSVGKNAFAQCYKLVEIYNLSSVEIAIGDESADGCKAGDYALNIFTATSGAAGTFFEENGFEFYRIADDVSLIGYSGSEEITALPASVNGGNYKIHAHALAHAPVTDLEIGAGVTEIGQYAFSGSETLQSVKIGDSVTEIPAGAFSGCPSLNSVELGKKVQTVNSSAFLNCGSLFEIGNFSETLEVTGKIGGMPNMPLNIYTAPEGKGRFATVGEFVFYSFGDRNLLCKYNGEATALTLPADFKGGTYELRRQLSKILRSNPSRSATALRRSENRLFITVPNSRR